MDKLAKALRILVNDIVSDDGVATTVLLQAAGEIERLRRLDVSRLERHQQIVDDLPRWHRLPIVERLNDSGSAMKFVPTFAVNTMREAANEIERLRLTPEERDCLWTAAEAYAENNDDPECERIAVALQGLWERTR